jgi:hypothetical protein
MKILTPCDGCPKSQRCRAEGLACEAFVVFKRVSPARDRWQLAPRFPTKALFELANEPVKFKPARPLRARRIEVELEAVDTEDDMP